MRSTGQLTVLERLGGARRNRRAAGTAVAAGTAAAFVAAVAGLYAGYYFGDPTPGPGLVGWAVAHPLPALFLIALACAATGAAALAVAYRPAQRRFVFDRASVYVVSGGEATRHALVSVRLEPDAPEGPTMHVADRSYLLDSRDLMRVAGLLRVVIQPRSRKARPVAACNPTVIELPLVRARPRAFVSRHPTGVA